MRRYHSLFFLVLLASLPAVGSAAGGRDKGLEVEDWGRAIDPDGDCTFTVGKGRLTIAIPGTVHALSAELGRVNAPRILRDVEGDFIAQVKVSGVSAPGSRSLVPGRRPFRAAGLLLWRGEDDYVRLERAGMVIGGERVNYANFELRKDGRFGRIGDASERPLDGRETYLRLERRGGTLIASMSPDGVRWTSLEPLAVDLPERLRIGIAALHNTSEPFEPRFEDFKLFRGSKEGR